MKSSNIRLPEYKQPTHLIEAKSEEEKRAFADSSLALIRDWEKGYFEVPLNMLEDFILLFNKSGTRNSWCKYRITKEEIKAINEKTLKEYKLSLAEKIEMAADRQVKASVDNYNSYVKTDKTI